MRAFFMSTDVLINNRLHVGGWAQLGLVARMVRTAVFIEEQGISDSEEWDDDDALALHAVITTLAERPLATGRLITAGQALGHAKIGRMAVLQNSRGAGLGRQILQALVRAARQQGVQQLSLHAQTSAQDFYQREGFSPEGTVFDEVGIPHIVMILRL